MKRWRQTTNEKVIVLQTTHHKKTTSSTDLDVSKHCGVTSKVKRHRHIISFKLKRLSNEPYLGWNLPLFRQWGRQLFSGDAGPSRTRPHGFWCGCCQSLSSSAVWRSKRTEKWVSEAWWDTCCGKLKFGTQSKQKSDVWMISKKENIQTWSYTMKMHC